MVQVAVLVGLSMLTFTVGYLKALIAAYRAEHGVM